MPSEQPRPRESTVSDSRGYQRRRLKTAFAGIVVSNHAGRQVDGAIASLDALKSIVDAGVGEKITVMFDS
jgi:isopentenyl diphosphate isomerase/L-lactate dehydrogenase-like FMN-dependent dehydrogenase